MFLTLAIILSWASYSAAAFKSVAFVFIIVLMLSVFMQFGNDPFRTFILILLFMIVIFQLFGFFFDDSIIFVHWFRRAFLSPGRNLSFFYDYIDFWSLDGLRGAPAIISQVYYGAVGSANSGLYGNGLAVAGIVGIFRNILLFFVYLLFLDSASKRIPLHLSGSLVLPQAYALANSGTLTVFFTYGLAFSIIFLWLLGEAFYSKNTCLNMQVHL